LLSPIFVLKLFLKTTVEFLRCQVFVVVGGQSVVVVGGQLIVVQPVISPSTLICQVCDNPQAGPPSQPFPG